MPKLILPSALLALLCFSGCTTKADDPSEWCDGYMEFSYAMLEWESTEPGSDARRTAESRVQTIGEQLYETPVPAGIEDDFAVVVAGPDPTDGGDAHLAAIRRTTEWLIASCDFPAEFVDILDSE